MSFWFLLKAASQRVFVLLFSNLDSSQFDINNKNVSANFFSSFFSLSATFLRYLHIFLVLFQKRSVTPDTSKVYGNLNYGKYYFSYSERSEFFLFFFTYKSTSSFIFRTEKCPGKNQPVPDSWSAGTIGKAGRRQARSFLSRIPLVADSARPAPAFLIVPTEREPAAGQQKPNRQQDYTDAFTRPHLNPQGSSCLKGG